MKIVKKVMPLVIACVMAAACSEKTATTYTIECNLQGIPDGTVVEFVPVYTKEKPVAESVVTCGKALLKGVTNDGKKYILVDFWASWCAPCRREIPNLKKLYAQYSSEGFEIISLSIDKKEVDWEKALEEEKLVWPNYLDTKGAAGACHVSGIPAMFLLNDKGIVIAENIRGKELEDKLAELFK
jgi:thiol-disulfide isomerase/thioredoxin